MVIIVDVEKECKDKEFQFSFRSLKIEFQIYCESVDE